jgi:hypothetical protein
MAMSKKRRAFITFISSVWRSWCANPQDGDRFALITEWLECEIQGFLLSIC